ncbi:hypothetical protein Q6280_28055, partial [Klebsiella pneumoniae]|nr:hypothetical protein [Klebsiella pneumoniae]
VYSAGEDPIEGVSSDTLVSRIRASGHRDVAYIEGPEAVEQIVRDWAKEGDFIVYLGAGNITQWAYALPKELEAKG